MFSSNALLHFSSLKHDLVFNYYYLAPIYLCFLDISLCQLKVLVNVFTRQIVFNKQKQHIVWHNLMYIYFDITNLKLLNYM